MEIIIHYGGKKTIHFILTGGTIDSFDKDINYPLVPHKKSVIPTYIKSLKLSTRTEFTQVCFKDSRDISKDDIKKILKVIEKSKHKQIIITYGTFTMPDFARLSDANLKRKDQTIVLTGSMIPLYGFPMSDGSFNLGYAVAKVKELPPGVYVCMNGRTFSSKNVMKVTSEGRFESVI